MLSRLLVTAALSVVTGFATAEEFDAVVDDGTRQATKAAKAPEKFYFGKILVDSKGRVVSQVNVQGQVTKDTKVARGSFDEKTKTWVPGEAIEGGVEAELFKDQGKVLRVRVKVADDGTTIRQVLVTDPDARLERAEGEFDAIYRGRGKPFSGRTPISFQRVELDEKGRLINRFYVATSIFTQDTKVAMGKYNEKEDKWEAGEDIANGVYGDLFKDPGAKNIYVRITYRTDGRGIAQILVRRVGEQGNK
jgi:hypothetical protein